MKRQLTKGLLLVCAMAVIGMIAACGEDDMHKEAKKLAKLNVKLMELEEEMNSFTNDLIEKYGEDSSSFVNFQLLYIDELLKLDIKDEAREDLTKTAKYLKGEISEAEYYGFDFDMDDMEYMEVDPDEMDVDEVVDSVVSTMS